MKELIDKFGKSNANTSKTVLYLLHRNTL